MSGAARRATGGRVCVSIIVPCFNSVLTIGAAIESALEQRDIEIEIIVVDDGSSDNSMGIARGFQASRSSVSPARTGAFRRRAIGGSPRRRASGSFFWTPMMCSRPERCAGGWRRRRRPAPMWSCAIGRSFPTVGEGAVRSIDVAARRADAEIACATHVWATTAALMYRRGLVEKIGGFREDLPVIQDARFLFDAAYHGARFAHSAHVGARYRITPQSLSRRDPARFWRDALMNGKQIEALWRERRALTSRQMTALIDIYNGAAHGLFRAGDPAFREALAALRACGLPVGRRNQLAELLSDIAGQSRAVQSGELLDKIATHRYRPCVGSRRSSDRPRGSKRGRADGTRRCPPGTDCARRLGRGPPRAVHLFPRRGRRHRNLCRGPGRGVCGLMAFTARSPRPGTSTTATCTTICRSFALPPSAAPISIAPMGRPIRERRNRSWP